MKEEYVFKVPTQRGASMAQRIRINDDLSVDMGQPTRAERRWNAWLRKGFGRWSTFGWRGSRTSLSHRRQKARSSARLAWPMSTFQLPAPAGSPSRSMGSGRSCPSCRGRCFHADPHTMPMATGLVQPVAAMGCGRAWLELQASGTALRRQAATLARACTVGHPARRPGPAWRRDGGGSLKDKGTASRSMVGWAGEMGPGSVRQRFGPALLRRARTPGRCAVVAE